MMEEFRKMIREEIENSATINPSPDYLEWATNEILKRFVSKIVSDWRKGE